ncbi:ABC-2 type transporter [Halalkalicoccus jeotgali B3]|uniref:ABC-2 type transporter n=1 Tax=Halalkalicoccus jeotgali (strain DSM 18796 / CECT 7217 / JCM 14584 / KCTC 4019 / B3) TaxID=795797 RepID=D8J7A2_HALJB|nr:ABC transporter permease subunit [Halalkalicoccus jeotgali]ADJ13997.1 ABC-2 type transporter [Halalkalicoccus jeotgali B3]ELY33958.1 ABC-2 type transporter [Halalkalicoccus jeotgali B3]
MSLLVVSKKEFLDTVRSNALLVTTLAFVLWAGFLAAIQHVPNVYVGSDLPRDTLALMNSMQQSAVFFVPLIGLGLGYNAIVGERERGSLKFLLGLPHPEVMWSPGSSSAEPP